MTPELGPRYRLTRELGARAGVDRFLGVDRWLERAVEIQVVKPERLGTSEDVDAFRRVAVRLAELESPRLQAIHDVSVGAHTFLVVEHGARTLRDLVAQVGALSMSDAATVLRHVREALDELHAYGLVHGDVSLDTVLIDDDGRARLCVPALLPDPRGSIAEDRARYVALLAG